MHLYENRTPNHICVNIVSEDKTKIIPFTFAPFSKKEFNYPALDMYVPSLLTKICQETGCILLPNKKQEERKETQNAVIEVSNNEMVTEPIEEFTSELVEVCGVKQVEEIIEPVEEIVTNIEAHLVETEVKIEDEEKPKTKRNRKK